MKCFLIINTRYSILYNVDENKSGFAIKKSTLNHTAKSWYDKT